MSGGLLRIEPSGLEITVADGESIMAAASRHGLDWPTVCRGKATCRTCYLVVVAGAEHFTAAGPAEAEAIGELTRSFGRVGGPIRLACQANIVGDAVVSKYGVRPAPGTSNGRGADR